MNRAERRARLQPYSKLRKGIGLQPLRMAIPKRNAKRDQILSPSRTFFTTTKTSMGRALLQSERNATLLIDVLRSYVAAGKFELHDFVVMPNHVHLLITVSGDSTVERVMQSSRARLFLSIEEGIWVFGRSLATRLFRAASRGSRNLCALSGIHRSEPREGRIGGFTRKVSLLLHLSGKN
jgi:REP element-mobilizing transposase RayT